MYQFKTRAVFDAVFKTNVFTNDVHNTDAKNFVVRTAIGYFSSSQNTIPMPDSVVSASNSIAVAHLLEEMPILREVRSGELIKAVRLVTPERKLLQIGVEAMFKEECQRLGVGKTISLMPIKNSSPYFLAAYAVHTLRQKKDVLAVVSDKAYQVIQKAHAVHQSYLYPKNCL